MGICLNGKKENYTFSFKLNHKVKLRVNSERYLMRDKSLNSTNHTTAMGDVVIITFMYSHSNHQQPHIIINSLLCECDKIE